MSGLFGNLELSKRALFAQQAKITTTSHNISNANTEGYSRQDVVLEAGRPTDTVFGQLGNGVMIKQIKRQHDRLLFEHFINENSDASQWDRRNVLLGEIESILNEPSEFGLSKSLTEFFNAWSELANHPELKSMKINVVEKSKNLVDAFHYIDEEFSGLRQRIADEVEDKVKKMNSYAKQIAELNVSIASIEYAQNRQANDLRDKRDQILKEMAKIADISYKEFRSGMIKVTLSGLSIVENDQVYEIAMDRKTSTNDYDKIQILFPVHNNKKVTLRSGELKALMDIRDDFLIEQLKKINQLAVNLVQQVNKLHKQGFTGTSINETSIDFFNPVINGAKDIQLNYDILQNPEKVAPSKTGAPGDNAIAIEIARLKDKKTMDNNQMTFSRYYDTFVSAIGQKAQESDKYRKNHEILLQQVQNFMESATGVQLDGELTDLIRYQSSYQAAARLVTTIDKLLDTVINRMAT